MIDDSDANPPTPGRGTLIRDLAVLQLKLIVDGLRDFVLVPVSLVIGVISLFRAGDRPGTEFYELLKLGRKTDHAINLFGAADRIGGVDADHAPLPEIDDLIDRVERYVVDEHRRGGLTAQARERLDRLLDALARQSRASRQGVDDSAPD